MERYKGNMMSLNIKSEEAHQLARKLAALTGESQATAVTVALRERLDRLEAPPAADRVALLLDLGRDCARHLREPYRSIDHGDLLYDEQGLPR
ncbi:MAG: type II toxin-antitoxin system VapB family antitoxin [Chloroflexota bacterium]